METVIDALKAMGKASYREVAARLKIEPVEALNMLREQREQGLCDFFGGAWEVTGGAVEKSAMAPQSEKPVLRAKNLNDTPKKPLRGEVTEPIKPETIVALLTENGDMDTVALASAVGRDPRGLASNLCLMAKRRHIKKIGQGKGVKWGLPDETKIIPEPVFAELPDIENTPKVAMIPAQAPSTEREHVSVVTETFLESIPVLRKPSQPMQIPSLREISNQIRKTKSSLNRLEKLRNAVREVNKHSRALRLFCVEGE
ncbi:DUF1627 domain-containing protein [Salmonella enterica]|nr:DUF1627 domain-containing protein [Salmonella enterica]EEG8800484.1 DUF1627 domain-containing protein [Salmonella enterica subsp. enterica serovar Durham]EAP7666013.1 DUF1627 domain-containing protein [Salmonella enterica]EBA9763380.1 DUF1627 domain-containing protein [Salmonella enterica]EBD4905439.1 DUF1627 domain-containing protein [Salmonella enterica]